MERVIKFRGLDVNGNWHEGLLSVLRGLKGQPEKGHYISNDAGMPWAYKVRPETVGEYTGLTDKNGTDIYEGDILRSQFSDMHVEIGVVEFINAGFWIADRSVHMPKRHLREVIGNTYENPELLKQKVEQ